MPYANKEDRLANGRAYGKRPEVKAARKICRARADVKAKARSSQMRWRYGITRNEFNELFAAQGKRCAICRAADPGPRDWHIDHDHVSGKVRGILCRHCNPMLGKAKDDPDILRQAAAYLDADIIRQYDGDDAAS